MGLDSETACVKAVNFAALGMVVGIKADLSRQYLSDIFACLIETNRKLQKEVKINLSSTGYL